MKKYKGKEEHMLKDEYIKEDMLIKRNGER
jgi:hypothetical protein